LKITQTYVSNCERQGEVLEFYEDGSRKMEAELKNGQYLIHNYWNESGEHTLKNGTGAIIRSAPDPNEYRYKNYKKDGEQKMFDKNVLIRSTEMADGVNHGYERDFYKNGKLKHEILYEHGKILSTKFFPKSENLKGKTTFQYLMNDEWLLKKNCLQLILIRFV
jgi:antitoxin component YwqK of YwqJK toxin-antitoxin module